MIDFVVHGVPGSPYLRAVLLALEEKGADWQLAPVAMGAHRAQAYRAIHPFNKIPTLDHGDFRLYEIRAILGYIDRVLDGPSLTPADPRRAARMDQMIGIVDCYLAARVSGPLTFPRVVAPKFGLPVDEAAIAAAVEPATHVVGEVARLLGDRRFLTGETLTLADLMAIPHFDFLPHFAEGRQILLRHPELDAWIGHMAARPSLEATRWDALQARIAA